MMLEGLCAAKAAEAGIPLEDIQEEVGDIQDLITAKLEEAAEAAEPGQDEQNASAARTAENENKPIGKP